MWRKLYFRPLHRIKRIQFKASAVSFFLAILKNLFRDVRRCPLLLREKCTIASVDI